MNQKREANGRLTASSIWKTITSMKDIAQLKPPFKKDLQHYLLLLCTLAQQCRKRHLNSVHRDLMKSLQ